MAEYTQNFLITARMRNLKNAIELKDKRKIFLYYAEINALNFEQIDEELLDEFDKLVSKGNNILYA